MDNVLIAEAVAEYIDSFNLTPADQEIIKLAQLFLKHSLYKREPIDKEYLSVLDMVRKIIEENQVTDLYVDIDTGHWVPKGQKCSTTEDQEWCMVQKAGILCQILGRSLAKSLGQLEKELSGGNK
ncbi:hypothetical protein LCGC14_0232770 [marine sediment metagenome]|uniref:Uncharacterized protein n=1 Tax=marine sediment metagenome TaxID=412755 RepID=A0A0F9WUW7_9ZZZZ